ncbi:cysteine desulfurase / selenocysteine lyase [Catalinimonas alkaloidigena]|uniref:Cysteine desulfurase n=1 Tax=Catalinimonas alkaloidigena TaxID=1075417 RepID=A0A1G9NAM8_9BACT|nr:cysteine desulfurase [Catalinimonas alkaloidigena]SDL83489.1 cysteine desulfurase / selenocysteine lyase [Catalinimonas alkaloidigena]
MATLTSSVGTSFDVEKIRQDFPVLHQEVNGKPLAYFDNAATTQKPQAVLDALTHYYTQDNANIHRGIHTLAERATAAFEHTRETVRTFLNAPSAEEIIFTRGTTEGINLVASSWGHTHLQAGDEVIISGMEHHSNIVPWQMVCEARGATLKVIPVRADGSLDLEAFEALVSSRTKMVAVVYVSNSLGTINPVKTIIDKAHAVGARVLIDGAQASSHLNIDVQALDCDFYVFSGHKIYGPTGVGALFGKREVLEAMPPYQGGGEMIKEVTFEKTTYNDIPYKFEAGTPNIADVVAMKAAIDYLQALGKDNLAAYEHELLTYATQAVQDIPGLKLVGTASEKISILSFVLEGIHHFDIGMMLDARGVAIRTGHHCTQPLMHHFGLEGTARASFAFYNTTEEVDRMVEGLHRIAKLKG